MNNRPPALLDWILMFSLAAMWGASFFFIKHAVQILSPLQMAVWRMVLATLVYLPFAFVYWSKIDWKKWRPLVVVAMCGSAIPNFLFAIAQQHVNSSLAGILNSLTPLFTIILGILFFKAHFSRDKIAGVLIGLTGATMLVLFNGQSGQSGNAWYAGLCALATACYAINANSVGFNLKGMHPAAIGSASFMITGPFFLASLFLTDTWTATLQNPDGWKAVGYVTYLAAVGTVVGSILYFHLLQRTSTVFATYVTYLLPVMAILIGAFDGETIGAMDVVGTLVILAGLYLARR